MRYKPLNLLNIALAALLMAVFLTVKLKGPDNLQAEPAETDEVSSQAKTDEIPAAEKIQIPLSEQLFGTPSLNENQIEIPVACLPENIKLQGTITGPASVARAILTIKDSDKNEAKTVIFKLGDKLPGEFAITEIQKNHIVLENQGKKQKLMIVPGEIKAASPAISQPKHKTQAEPIELSLPKTRNDNRKMSGSLLCDSQWNVATDLEDNTIGIRLENIKELSQIAQCGLRNGDIIKSINNQQLKSYQQTYQVLQKARLKKKILLEVIRDGQIHKFENDLTDEPQTE